MDVTLLVLFISTRRTCVRMDRYTIGNVFIITLLLIFIFSVMGIQLFAGTFASCNDNTIRFEEQCVGTYLQYVIPPPIASARV